MNTQRPLFLFPLLIISLLTACGAAASTMAAPTPSAIFYEATTAPEATEAPYPTPAPTQGAIEDSAPGGSSQLAYAQAGNKLVIKDAEIELLVRDTDVGLAQVTQMTVDRGGYILSSQTWYQDGFKFASLRLGIPSAEFEKALNYLRGLALQIVRENASGQDVSAEYADLQSRLTNLEATAARVREFLADAKTVEESLRINGQLAELEGQIEQVKGQMNFYQGRAAFSTLTVLLTPQYPTPTPTLTPTPTPTPTPTQGWNPGTTFNAASQVLTKASQTTTDLLIWLIVVVGPFALVLMLILGVTRRLWRKRGP